jgi:hypothetical protein
MSQTKTNPIFHLMPSLTDVAFLMPLVFLFSSMSGVRALLSDGDTGWHIRIGDWILAHHAVPRTDMFSFTMPGQPFFAWEWLWDAGASWIHQRWGLAGVVLVSMFIICLTFTLLFRIVNRRCGHPLLAIGLTVLAAAGSTIHWLARPHLFTMLFTVIFLAILERVREGRTKLLWWLPLLTVLWANIHAGFLAGIIILGAYAAGELVGAAVAASREDRLAGIRSSAIYVATAAGCLAASLINPYFYHLHVHLIEYLHSPYQMKYIGEFQGVNFQEASSIYLEAMMVVGLAAVVWCIRRKRFGELILLVGWGHLALIAGRNIPIFVIVAAPVTAAALVEWLNALKKAPVAGWIPWAVEHFQSIGEEIEPMERPWRIHAVCAAAMVLIAFGMSLPGAGIKLKPEYDPKSYPQAALVALGDSSHHVFTHDEWGDYLLYKLSPKGVKVFVDGRSDFYGDKLEMEYVGLMDVKYDWKEKLAKYDVDTVLLPVNAALAGAMKESSHWRVVYDDGMAIVFLANDAGARGNQNSTSSIGGRRDLKVTGSDVVQKTMYSKLGG